MNGLASFIIDHIEFMVAICGGIFALLQWRESNTNKRAEYLNSLLERLWENKDIQDFILLNDYDKEWYNEEFHRSNDKTIPTLADKTLSLMNYICYVEDVKIIRKKERGLFDYYLSALGQCKDMRRYLFDLYQYSVLNDKPFLFSYFLDVCIKLGILPKAMKDKNFFKYIMLSESAANKGIAYELPKEITALNDELSNTLFLRTCSRCKHCKKFAEGKCTVNEDIKLHYWLPLNQASPCPSFDFDDKTQCHLKTF